MLLVVEGLRSLNSPLADLMGFLWHWRPETGQSTPRSNDETVLAARRKARSWVSETETSATSCFLEAVAN
jgi:hypothetical protein